MTTTVPSLNDHTKALARFAAIEARLDALEAIDIPPVPPVEPPVVSEPPVNGPFAWTRSRPFNPPAIARTPADLVAARLMLPFATAKRYAPMTFVPNDWPGNDDFSGDTEGALVNDATGEWLGGGDPHNMFVWAESHGALPHHWINPATGRLWSIEETPRVNTYWREPTFDGTSSSPIKLDTAHYPAVCFIAYLATRDPYYLEELQFAANFHTLALNPDYRMDEAKKVDLGLFHRHQMRGWVWHLRDTVAAYLATPEGDVSAPLLPKSYWKRIIDNNRDWVLANWIGSAHAMSGLHMFPLLNNILGNVAPWQQDWAGAVIGWMIWSGQFDDWRAIYEWQIQQALDRTSGLSGFPRSSAIGYWWKTGVSDMAGLAAVNDLVETPDGKFPVGFNTHYAESLRANLKIAMLNGVAEAEPCFAYVDGQVVPPDPRWAL